MTYIAILIMATLFLLPALANGFPFVYYDSGEYVYAAIHRYIPYGRPVYYGVFTIFLDLRLSPWPSVIAQSLITAWLIWRFALSFFAISSAFKLLSLGLVLTVGSSLPWFVGEIMPDLFTALMILALALLCLSVDTLPRSSAMILALLISVSVAFHQANIVVALCALPALGLCAVLGWRSFKLLRSGVWASVIGLALGASALLVQNLIHHRFSLSSGGSVFFMARLLEDGTAISYLEDACPQQRFAVCAFLDDLKSERWAGQHFLFGGPLEKLGGFRGEEAEAATIVHGTLSTYPVEQLRATLNNGWRQMLSFRTGAELHGYAETDLLSKAIETVFGRDAYDQYLHSEQIRGDLFHHFNLLNRIHVSVLAASVLFLAGFFIFGGRQKHHRAFVASIFIIVLVAGNALILGGLSGPNDRYQSRVIWLVPLLATCLVLQGLPYPWDQKRNGPAA